MKLFWTGLVSLVLTLPLFAQQDVIYAAHAETRTATEFKGIDVSAGIQVVLTHGEEAVVVTADDQESIDKIITTVENGILKIGIDTDWRIWKMAETWGAKVYVSYQTLEVLKANSGASIRGSIGETDNMEIVLSSGSVVEVDGSANYLKAEASSGALLKSYDLRVKDLKAGASSGGGVQVTASNEVNADASSGGFIRYKGDATIKNINVSSGGSVKKIG